MEEELVRRAGLPFRAIPAGPLRGLGILEAARNLASLPAGIVRAWGLLREFRPGAAFVTGGYVCVPVVLAAWLRRVPVLIYLPDIVPGLAVRLLSRLARRVALSCERSLPFFPAGIREKVVVTGYPVRREFLAASNFQPPTSNLKTVIILGGSRGAHSLNVALDSALEKLLERYQVIHICGREDAPAAQERREGLAEEARCRYKVYPYLHEGLAGAMASADLVLCRAGASILGELPALGLPAVLVPYPYAGKHQVENARYLAEGGAAIVIEDAELEDKIWPVLTELLEDEQKLSEMSRRARALARPEAAREIASELVALAKTDATH